MAAEIVRLLAFEGPNIRWPQPGVLLKVAADRDRSARVRAALKDAAQQAGVVIGSLAVEAAAGAPVLITAGFTTPTPALGAAVARYVVDGLNARERGDDSWDAEGLLWELQKRRRAEALPVAALQLMAEAAARGVPAFVRGDDRVQLGYGARGWSADMAPLRERRGQTILVPGEPAPASPPWERLGAVPVVAVAGGAARAVAVAALARELRARGLRVAAHESAGFAETRLLLADPEAELVVVGLDPGELLRRGLALEGCAHAAVLGLPDAPPAEAAGRAELARALGVPALLAGEHGVVALDAGTPEVAALAEYAGGRVELLHAGDAAELGARAAEAILRAMLGQASPPRRL